MSRKSKRTVSLLELTAAAAVMRRVDLVPFEQSCDLYRAVAASLLDCHEDEVTQSERTAVKSGLFLALYT